MLRLVDLRVLASARYIVLRDLMLTARILTQLIIYDLALQLLDRSFLI